MPWEKIDVLKGQKGDAGPAGTNATTTAAATTSANGLMSATDKTKLDATPVFRFQQVSIAASILPNATTGALSVTWPASMPSTSYDVFCTFSGGASFCVDSIGSKTTAGCTVTLRNVGLSAIVAGSVNMSCMAVSRV